MTYVYDLVLNFNSEIIYFYEWNQYDEYCHIKKMNLWKVKPKILNDIIDYKVTFTDDKLLDIFNKCEYYSKKNMKTLPYAFLLTDGYRVMALLLDESLKTIKYSTLLLDEENEIIEISKHLLNTNLTYNINEKQSINILTRKELLIVNYLKKELKASYLEKDLAKLRYLYYEYYNDENDNLEEIYNKLIYSLQDFNEKHYNLYHLIKLSDVKVI